MEAISVIFTCLTLKPISSVLVGINNIALIFAFSQRNRETYVRWRFWWISLWDTYAKSEHHCTGSIRSTFERQCFTTSHALQWRLLELSKSRRWISFRNWDAASPAQLLSHVHSRSWCSVSALLCSVGTPSVSRAPHRQPAAWTMTLPYCSFPIWLLFIVFWHHRFISVLFFSLGFDILIFNFCR